MRALYTITLLLMLGFTAAAQINNPPPKEVPPAPPGEQSKKDTVKVKPDFIPTGVRVGTDLITYGRSIWDDTFKGWEYNVDVDFHRYYLAVDYGYWARSFPGDSVSYSNSGRYWRVGVDVNFLKNDPDRNMFFIGLRYGQSRFDEQMSIVGYTAPYWGSLDNEYANNNVSAHWMELTGGLRVKIYKFIWLGYTARFKFGLSTDESAAMIPYDVPGYGRTDRDSYWGFNYQVLFRIPVRKVKSPVVAPKK